MASKRIGILLACLLALASPARAAYAFVAAVGGGSAAGGSFTTGSANMSGADLIVCGSVTYIGAGATDSTITDSHSNTYSYRTSYAGVSGSLRLAYTQGASVGTSGMTFTSTSSNGSSYSGLVCAGFSGSASTPYDAENGHVVGGSVTSDSPGSVTPGAANELFVTAIDDDFGNGTFTTPTGFTTPSGGSFLWHAGGQNLGVVLAYKIKTDAAAENPSWSWTNSSSSVEDTQAAFKVGAGVVASKCMLTLLGVGKC